MKISHAHFKAGCVKWTLLSLPGFLAVPRKEEWTHESE